MKTGMVPTQPRQFNRRALRQLVDRWKIMRQQNPIPDGLLHDIRNLLTVVLSNAAMLEDDLTGEQGSLVEGISRATWHLESLLDELQETRESTAKGNVSPSCLVREAVEFARVLHPGVRFELPNSGGVMLKIDEAKLLRCLLNLMLNAAEAAQKNSDREPVVELEISCETDGVQILVRDSGAGFALADSPHLFEPFFSTKSDQATRHGLGLYVVQSVVSEYGGTVEARRVEDLTEVRISFPIAMAVFPHSEKKNSCRLDLARV